MDPLNQTRKILAIDDNQTNLAVLKVHLEQIGLTVMLADNPSDGLELARAERPDLILLDIMMPQMDGYEVCKRLKGDSRTASTPVVFLSARNDPTDKVQGLTLGAVDYITKPFDPAELKARVRIILQMMALQERLTDQANTDELTGLANRRRFHELIEREVLQANLRGTELSLIMLDIDHFKVINDTYGHLGGDVILRKVAEIISVNVNRLDFAARYGGEEFVIVMPETSSSKALLAADRLRKLIEQSQWHLSSEPMKVTVSMGVATMSIAYAIDTAEFTRCADAALYVAKRKGRNRVIAWDEVAMAEQQPADNGHSVRELEGRITSMSKQLRLQTLGSVSALAKALEAKDPYTTHHSNNVQVYSAAIAGELDLTEEFVEQLKIAAQLHDLGKISIPNEILTKPGSLTSQERRIVERHPLISVQILEPLAIFRRELPMIKHHHERYDGRGYPDGIKDREIPFGARILAVADVFDSITSNDAYRSRRSMDQAVDEIRRNSGTQFDSQVVEAFLTAIKKNGSYWPLAEVESAQLAEQVV